MNSIVLPNHVAVLVPSVRKAADFLKQFNFQIGKEQIWDGEGTKEIYIERDKGNSLLLMEPVKPGAYQRAIEKRGPGLHHIAVDVQNLESFIETLSSSGWLLHPMSVKTMKNSQTAYLARPGFPALIEVQEREKLDERPLFVEGISLQMDLSFAGLLNFIGLSKIIRSSSSPTVLNLAGKNIKLENLIR